MTRHSLRVLASARDPGSAHQTAAFVRTARRRRWPVVFDLVGGGAAVAILEQTGLVVRRWPQVSSRLDETSARRAVRVLDEARPDVVLAGLAYPGIGPDEALRAAAGDRGLPVACIQDYWGYLGGFAPASRPDLFFVLDELAAGLTRRRAGRDAAVVVTGSPRHAEHADRSVRARTALRRSPLIVYFGQPASIDGCEQNLAYFVRALGSLPGPVTVRYRRHPNDTTAVEVSRRLFSTQPHRFEITGAERSLEADLLDADLSVTCFSSIGLDHHYLQLRSRRPLGPLLFVTIGPEVRRFLRRHVGIPAVPNVELGLAAGVSRFRELLPALEHLLHDSNASRRAAQTVRRRLAPYRDPCRVILRSLHRLVKGSRSS